MRSRERDWKEYSGMRKGDVVEMKERNQDQKELEERHKSQRNGSLGIKQEGV